MARLYYNQDCTDFFFTARHAAGEGGAALDNFVDRLAAARIDVLVCNTNAQLVNYASQVWQTFWDGYDPDGPDDQPLLAPLHARDPEAARAWRRLIGNMWHLWAEGVDYPGRLLERCRRRGLSPWISLRMNDVHNNDEPGHPIHSRFWREHPEFYRRGCTGYFARALDYAHGEVRDHYLRLIDESLTRYDVDGLELDFLREPYVFSRGDEARGSTLLTDWLGQVKEQVRAHAARRGHPIALGVRVPSRPEASLAMGLDAPAWARAGLLDVLVVSPRWATIEYDMPLPQWRRLLDGRPVSLLGGLEILLGAHPGAPKRVVTAEEARGAAAQVLASGADGVYLFNFFPVDPHTAASEGGDWRAAAHAETLGVLADAVQLDRLPRRHVLTFCDVAGPEGGELFRPALPAAGSELEFALPTGQCVTGDATLEVVLEAPAGAPLAAPAATVNGAAARLVRVQEEATAQRTATYAIEPGTLAAVAANRIRLRAAAGSPIRVVGIAIRVVPHGA